MLHFASASSSGLEAKSTSQTLPGLRDRVGRRYPATSPVSWWVPTRMRRSQDEHDRMTRLWYRAIPVDSMG